MPFLDVPPIPVRALQKRRITRIITKGNVIDWLTWSKAGQLHSGGLQAGGAENQVATQSKNQKPHNKGDPWCSPSMRVGGSLGKDDVSAHWEAREARVWLLQVMAAETHISAQEEWSLHTLVRSACLMLMFHPGSCLCWCCPRSGCPTRQTSPKTPSQTHPESVLYWFTKHS